MIDPKEIRAGNWVLKITGTDANARPFFEYRAIATNEYYYTFAEVCFPITISPSVLGKCGFKHEFGDWYMNKAAEGIDDGLPFLQYKNTEKSWYLEKIKLRAQPFYLHQLQNLFYALSNMELRIQLGQFENRDASGPINFFVKRDRKNWPIEELL